MEVKKEGIKPGTWRMDVACPNCKAELSVGVEDMGLQIITKDRILYTKQIVHFTVRCCECKKKILIKPVEIPLTIRKYLISNMDPLDFFFTFCI